MRARLSRWLGILIESTVLMLVLFTPWAFGAVEGVFELGAFASIALMTSLWAIRIFVDGGLKWNICGLTVCMLLLYLQCSMQVIPLPKSALAFISPSAASLYTELLPAERESLADGQLLPPSPISPGSTLSLYPAATRRMASWCLAVVCLFLCARHNIEPVGGLRRLAIAVVANAVLLSFLGLIQICSSQPNMIYGTFESPGTTFSTFICRNHFAFYINVCFFLGLGLLLYREPKPIATVRIRDRQQGKPQVIGGQPSLGQSLADALQDPRVLWLGAALAWIVGGSLMSLSRGGLAAFAATLLLGCLCLALYSRRMHGALLAGAVTLIIGGGIVGLVGIEKIESRFATTWKLDTSEARLPLWKNAATLIPAYYAMGTGYGTFGYVEPMTRDTARAVENNYEHAHNEYLEAIVEGGIPRLALVLVMLFLIARAGIALLRHGRQEAVSGLGLGALLAIVYAAIHSIGEFGVHIPAISVLLVIATAYLVGLREQAAWSIGDFHERRVAFSGGLLTGSIGIFSSLACLLVAYVLARDGLNRAQFQSQAGLADQGDPSTRQEWESQMIALARAESIIPDSGWAKFQLGYRLAKMYERIEGEVGAAGDVYFFSTTLGCSTAPLPAIDFALHMLTALQAADGGWSGFVEAKLLKEREAYLSPAAVYFVQARDVCPLDAKSNLRLATLTDQLPRLDDREKYLRRAKLLLPGDPEVWFIAGTYELVEDRKAEALTSWRRSCELSNEYLLPIVRQARNHYSPIEIVEQLLLNDPDKIVEAFSANSSVEDGEAWKKEFSQVAIEKLRTIADSLTPRQRHGFALLLWNAGDEAEGMRQLTDAIAEQPTELAWRVDYARFLAKRGSVALARNELLRLLAVDSQNQGAISLLASLPKQP